MKVVRRFEPEVDRGQPRKRPRELIRAAEEENEARYGPIVRRQYVGGGMVRKWHADGTVYEERLPQGISLGTP